MNMQNMEYIEKVFSENTGGGSIVDFIVLKSGQVLGMNDECVVLYSSMDDFWSGEYIEREAITL